VGADPGLILNLESKAESNSNSGIGIGQYETWKQWIGTNLGGIGWLESSRISTGIAPWKGMFFYSIATFLFCLFKSSMVKLKIYHRCI